ncbi:MAG: amidase [Sphingomonadaceae bacterium]
MADAATLLATRDAVGLAALVRAREVSAAELLDAALERVAATNPRFNYIVRLTEDRARAQLARPLPDGPLSGVPFLVKDLGVDIAGVETGNGSRFLRFTRTESSILVDRADAAGLVTFGKTTTPELGLTVTTESAATGITRNPWNPARIAGGSSGGAAVAVAVGAVPLAQASDGGGSVRVPAACCGLLGLKTSRGLVPLGPTLETMWNGLAVTGPISRSVRDAAAFLDAVAGPAPGTRASPPLPAGGFLAGLDAPVPPLRIAVLADPPFGVAVDPAVRAVFDQAVALLEELGHHPDPAELPIDFAALTAANITNIAVCTATDIDLIAAMVGHQPAEGDLEPAVANWLRMGRERSGPDQQKALLAIEQAVIAYDRFMAGYDLILTPTLARPPVEIGLLSLSNPDTAQFVETYTGFCPSVGLANLTQAPAITLPLGMTPDGLPVGVMAQGRYGADLLLLRLARQLEVAAPWADRRPPV